MARVTVEDWLEQEENRFALVVLAAARTRQLMMNGNAVARIDANWRKDADYPDVSCKRCHLLRVVRQQASYYNEDRPHMSLDGDATGSA